MADSMLAQALLRFAATESDPADPVYRQPFTTTVDGQVWAVATTGLTFMAVKGKASFPLKDDNTDVHALIRLQPDKSEEVVISELRSWCGVGPDRDDAVIQGRVFNRTRLGQLLGPCPFPKARMGTAWFNNVPALIVDVPGKWRVCMGAVDEDPHADHPVWGRKPTTETQLFDLAMSLE